jgi:choloylglycine hydrolase
VYPAPDSRPSISILQWVQYQLDNYSTIAEVIESKSLIRIPTPKSGVGTHYLVCEKSGECVAIEFIRGEMVYHTGKLLPVKAMTNSTYESSVAFWRQEGVTKLLRYNFSLSRFEKAAYMLTSLKTRTIKSGVEKAFEILNEVKQHFYYRTQWSIVYDIKNNKVFFNTLENQNIRFVDLQTFDSSCSTEVKTLDINVMLQGDVSNKLVDYSRETNLDYISKAYLNTPFLRNVPKNIIEARALYPESTVCSH